MRHPLRGGKLQQHSALLSQGRLGSAPGNNYPTDIRQMTFGFGGSLRRLSFSGKPESFRRDNLQASASPQHGRRLGELQNNASSGEYGLKLVFGRLRRSSNNCF
jgi:hypothetical protein